MFTACAIKLKNDIVKETPTDRIVLYNPVFTGTTHREARENMYTVLFEYGYDREDPGFIKLVEPYDEGYLRHDGVFVKDAYAYKEATAHGQETLFGRSMLGKHADLDMEELMNHGAGYDEANTIVRAKYLNAHKRIGRMPEDECSERFEAAMAAWWEIIDRTKKTIKMK
jgi:hypothetical protein